MKKAIFSILCVFVLSSYAKGQAQITFSEINYHPDSTRAEGEYVELYNYGSTAINLENWIFQDGKEAHFYLIPAITLQPGGYLVLSNNITEFNSKYPGVTNVVGSFNFGLSNKIDTLRLYDPNSVLQVSMTYLDSAGWPDGADGNGRTLELRNFSNSTAVLNNAANWQDGCIDGSPGTGFLPCYDPVVFSEINYNSNFFADAGDWVELKNTIASPIDVSGWIIRDKRDTNQYIFPAGTTLPGYGFLVISNDMAKFSSRFPAVTNVIGPMDLSFKNSKDGIRLFNAAGKLLFSVNYDNDAPWTDQADGFGYTLNLKDAQRFMNDGNNWTICEKGGSPGKQGCTLLSVDEETNLTSVSVSPNPFSNTTNFEVSLNNYSSENIVFSLTDMIGKQVGKDVVLEKGISSDAVKFSFERSGINSGVYFYNIKQGNTLLNSGKLVITD